METESEFAPWGLSKAHILVSTPVKAELLSWRSLCKAGNALLGTSLSAALRIGKHIALEIFGKKHSSAGAVLKGTAGHLRAFACIQAITSHNNEGTSLTGKRIVLRLPAETSQA